MATASPVFALYVPDPMELSESIALLLVAYAVLCGVAYWMKLSVRLAAGIMLLGAVIALAPDLVVAMKANLGDYGDMARETSQTNYSDGFFAVTSYMHVGRGQLVGFAGILTGFLICAYFRHSTRVNVPSDENHA